MLRYRQNGLIGWRIPLGEELSKCRNNPVGRISDSLAAEKEKGWEFLFGAALKSYVEGKPTPEWQD